MQPTLLTPPDISRYLDDGWWTKETQAERFAYYAAVRPSAIACQDSTGAVTWAELDAATDQLAANLVDLGLSGVKEYTDSAENHPLHAITPLSLTPLC